MRSVILTTKQNYQWTSMQEILPSLEKLWGEACENKGYEVVFLDVDNSSPRENARTLLSADLVIVSAFNISIANHLLFLRKGLGNLSPWVFYLHGLATIGMWPPLLFGLKNQFLGHDIFIGTCKGDKYCLEHIFERFHYNQVPFYLLPIEQEELVIDEGDFNFHFMGRLSPQKNLKSLIKAFALFEKENPKSKLHLFGEEDHLGHPNMGITCDDYKEQLQSLVIELSLEQKVIFHGFINRKKIEYLLNHLDKRKHFFISASTHSDENFGMAALRALGAGWKCLLSDWGGHKNYFKNYPLQAGAIPWQESDGRPDIISKDIYSEMKKVTDEDEVKYDSHLYTYDYALSLAEDVLSNIDTNEDLLVIKNETEKLLERKNTWGNEPQRIFESYDDPVAQYFLWAYGRDY